MIEQYHDEYAPVAPTERLHWPTEPLQLKAQAISLADQLLPARPGLMIVALVLIVAGAIKLGWEARGLWGPLVDNRGWAALVVFSIVGSVFMVNYSNRKEG